MAYALAGGLGSSMMFSYISVSAFVFIDVYHFTPVQFSWLFGCNAAALIVAAQLNARVLRTVSARSEEHTSELQSLMRISYAVFCLKKKTTHANTSLGYTRTTQSYQNQRHHHCTCSQ